MTILFLVGLNRVTDIVYLLIFIQNFYENQLKSVERTKKV